ncbi:putative zinc finger protein [Orchesella cincta]|uniref:Putative zinc finger protein n=1 Tax=Orchesella cincta TaxID=48709 RepID=A0A1D2M4Z0_ORCCI|nr:putative zinc finger protein [Orchesella cincta]
MMEETDSKKWRACSFCFKGIPPPPPSTKGEEEGQVLKQFVTIFSRYVGGKCWNNVDSSAVTPCQECFLLMTTFCKLHHQIKSLELMAEWKIRQLKELVTTASAVQSRTERFERCFKDDDEALQNVTRFRKLFISSCDMQLSKALPRVLLTRGKVPPSNTGLVDSIELKPDVFSESLEEEESPFVDTAFESHFEVNFACSYCAKSFESQLKLTSHSKSECKFTPPTPVIPPRRRRKYKRHRISLSNNLSRQQKAMKFCCASCNQKFLSNLRLRQHQRSFFHIFSKTKRRKATRKFKEREKITSKTLSLKLEERTEENGLPNIGILRPLRKTRVQQLVLKEESDSEPASNFSEENGDSRNSSFTDASSSSRDSKQIKRRKSPKKKCKTVRPKRARPHKCNVSNCNLAFEWKEHLENHSQLHGSFPCQFCSIVEDYAPNLATHEASVHATGRKAKPRRKHKKQVLNQFPSRDFVCPRCDFSTFSKAFYLNHHAETHLGLSRKSVLCPICSARFVNDKGIKFGHHRKAFHDVKGMDPQTVSKCDQCPAYFRKGFQLIRHKKNKKHSQTNEKTAREQEREQRFETLNELEWHTIGLHNSKKEDLSVICSECGRRFADLIRLKIHMVVHDEQHKKLMEKLWDHLRTHTREKPFLCNVCGEEYAHAHNLRNHMNKQHAANVQPRKYTALQLESKKWRKLRK